MSLRNTLPSPQQDLRPVETDAQSLPGASRRSAGEIVADARAVLNAARQAQLPSFVRDHFARLASMLEMAVDPDWLLGAEDSQRLLNALACFDSSTAADEKNRYLDHAIMIELVSRDLEHDLAAYRDFCAMRASRSKRHRPDADDPVRYQQWLQHTRETLQQRMHTRRARSLERSGSSVRRLFSLFGL